MTYWINITKGADKSEIKRAKEAARASNQGILPALPFTEGNYSWVLLYDHARKGQINLSELKRMRRSDLEYLAGMTLPHPDLIEPRRQSESEEAAQARHEQATKLLGNVARATRELSRRNRWWAIATTAATALLGVLLGAWLAG